MTKDEAIFELGYAKDFQTPKRKEAIDMAIEALENNDKLAEDLQNCLEMYKKKKAEVEALKQTQWIPCSERLPEPYDDVLISVKGYVCEAHLRESEEYFLTHRSGRLIRETEVDAWRELPKPYEGRTE